MNEKSNERMSEYCMNKELKSEKTTFRQSLSFLDKNKMEFEDCPRVASYHTYLVAEASIRDLTYCPQQAKNCSVYSEWNCLRTVIIPTTNGALSI